MVADIGHLAHDIAVKRYTVRQNVQYFVALCSVLSHCRRRDGDSVRCPISATIQSSYTKLRTQYSTIDLPFGYLDSCPFHACGRIRYIYLFSKNPTLDMLYNVLVTIYCCVHYGEDYPAYNLVHIFILFGLMYIMHLYIMCSFKNSSKL